MSGVQPTSGPLPLSVLPGPASSLSGRPIAVPVKVRVALFLAGFYVAMEIYQLNAQLVNPSTTSLLRGVPGLQTALYIAVITGLLAGVLLVVVEYSGWPLVGAASCALCLTVLVASAPDLTVVAASYGLAFGLSGLLSGRKERRYFADHREQRREARRGRAATAR